MELKDLQGVVLIIILTSMILGIGLIVFYEFGVAAKESTSVNNESIVFSEGIGIAGNDDVTSLDRVENGTDIWVMPDVDMNFTTNGTIYINESTGDTLLVSYTYDYDTTTTTATDSLISASTPIATTWLPLIVTVVVLAIILGLVIRSFGRKRR